MWSLLLEVEFTIEDYLLAFALTGILILLFSFFWLYQKRYFNLSIAKLKAKFQLSKNTHFVLIQYFPYYIALENKLKKEFVKRVNIFVRLKHFIPRQLKSNDTINILIAATAIQLTFGLKDFSLLHFKNILIYPSTYYSEIRKTYHNGEVNTTERVVVLSAEHFLEGMRNANNGINLGLHEFAHALHINAFKTKATDFIKHYNEWSVFADLEMLRIEESEQHFLRKYAANNLNEMFAVCTENFFERPEEFKIELPFIYEKMVVLYNQNPLFSKNPLKI